MTLCNLTKVNYEPYADPAEMLLPRLYLSDDDANFVAELGPTIQTAVTEFFARSATGQADVDAEWDGFQQSLEDMGLEQFIAIQQATYDRTMEAS